MSHLLQHQPPLLAVPSRPAGLDRLGKGLHVTTGTVAVPLLLATLWTVHPRLFVRPLARACS